MKMSKSARLFSLVLAGGLVTGLVGVWQDGWSIGDTIGFTFWGMLLIGLIMLVRRENRA